VNIIYESIKSEPNGKVEGGRRQNIEFMMNNMRIYLTRWTAKQQLKVVFSRLVLIISDSGYNAKGMCYRKMRNINSVEYPVDRKSTVDIFD